MRAGHCGVNKEMISLIFCPFQGNVSSLHCTESVSNNGLLLSFWALTVSFLLPNNVLWMLDRVRAKPVILEIWWDLEMRNCPHLDRGEVRHKAFFSSAGMLSDTWELQSLNQILNSIIQCVFGSQKHPVWNVPTRRIGPKEWDYL